MTTDPTRKLGLSLDPAALNALKMQSHGAPQAALKTVAKQFEAVFLNMMLKSMRETVSQDGLTDNQQTKMFTGMLDEQYASQLTQGRGLGLADMIVKQLGGPAGAQPASGAALPPTGAAAAPAASPSNGSQPTRPPAAQVSAGVAPGLPTRALQMAAAQATRAVDQPADNETSEPLDLSAEFDTGLTEALSQLAGLASSAVTSKARQLGAALSVPTAFKQEMAAHAAAASQATGIPADFMIAQAGLESGWGQHQPRSAGGEPSHNLFGIKAGANWKGPVIHAATTEVVNGVSTRVVQPFRAYGSYGEAFQDYAALLSGSARYARAMSAGAQQGSAQGFATALQKAGYATDPSYAGKLERAIRLTGGLRA